MLNAAAPVREVEAVLAQLRAQVALLEDRLQKAQGDTAFARAAAEAAQRDHAQRVAEMLEDHTAAMQVLEEAHETSLAALLEEQLQGGGAAGPSR